MELIIMEQWFIIGWLAMIWFLLKDINDKLGK